MKVLFKNLIQGYTGKADDYVIYYNRTLNKVIMRERPVYRNHPAHAPFKNVMKNLKVLNPSPAYRENCKAYLVEYNRIPANINRNIVTWSNLYQKIMWMLHRIRPEIELAELTRAQIESENLPCRSVKQAVQAGLIPKVRNYESLDMLI